MMESDVNGYYISTPHGISEKDPCFETNKDPILEKIEKESHKSQPKNKTDTKTHDVGLNHIGRHYILPKKEFKIFLVISTLPIDAETFKKWAQWDYENQEKLNQLSYIEEHIKEERESEELQNEEEVGYTELKKQTLNQQMKNIEINRFDPA